MKTRNIILLVLFVLILVFVSFVSGTFGWKIASLTQELHKFKSESLDCYQFEDGDLILFSAGIQKMAASSFIALEMLVTNSPITHVAMVFRQPETGLLRCWELALGNNISEIIRVSNLKLRLRSYRGTVLVRKLMNRNRANANANSNANNIYKVVEKIQKRHLEWGTRYRASFYLNTYDSRTSNMLFWHPPLPMDINTNTTPLNNSGDNNETTKEWICTDLISETYVELGIFDHIDLSLWPRDFYSKTQKLPLHRDWYFSPEIRLITQTQKVADHAHANVKTDMIKG